MSRRHERPKNAARAMLAAPPRPVRPWMILLVLLAATLPFARCLSAEFVFDDLRQIVDNHLIQDPAYFWTALRSDVWAFKAEQPGAVSNYWRPGAVLWMIVNHRLFGLNPIGWHAMNLAAHAFVCLLVVWVVLRLGASAVVAIAAACLFAVHPVHVESVCWAAASPDLQIGVGLLAAFSIYLAARNPIRPTWLLLAALLYATAMFSKETAAVFPLLVALSEWILTRGSLPRRDRLRRCVLVALPFVMVVAVYLALRLFIADVPFRTPPASVSLWQHLAFLPQAVVFYLRQSFLPFDIAPMHSLRAPPGAATLWPVLSPIVLLVVLVAWLRFRRRDSIDMLGECFFVLLLLLPLLNIRALLPEERVHDRYLYLPVLGIILIAANRGFARANRAPQNQKRFVIAAATLGLLLALRSAAASAAWHDNLALWRHAVDCDPNSSDAHTRLADQLRRLGRLDDARREFDLAMRIEPGHVEANVGRGVIAAKQGDWPTAQHYLARVLEQEPGHQTAADNLGQVYLAQKRYDEAVAVFEKARRAMPLLAAKYSYNIAVIALQRGDLPRAVAELESARDAIAVSPDRAQRAAFVMLGELYEKTGRKNDAASAFRRYLDLSTGATDPAALDMRRRAEAGLSRTAQ